MKNRLSKTAQSSIGLLLLSRLFERVAFYLLLSILVNYFTEKLQPGMKNISINYSLFMGAMMITTFFSGLLGDLRNRNKVVITGLVLLTAMYLGVPFLPGVNFLLIAAFVVLGVGIGLTTPNMVVLLGNIYNEKENEIRGLPGFILFTFMAELGGVLAPLITGFLKPRWGFTPIFLLAAACGLAALLLFLQFSRKYLISHPAAAQQHNQPSVSMRKLQKVILLSVLITALMAHLSLQLRGTTLVMALKDLTGMGAELSSMVVPMEMYLLPLLMLLFFVWVTRIRSMHWGRIFQMMLLGLAFAIVGYLTFAGFTSLQEVIGEKFIIYPSYSFLLIAESMLASTFLYAVYRSSPMKHKGLFQGIYYTVLAVAGGLLFTGKSLYEKLGPMVFMIVAGLLLINAIVLLWAKRSITKKNKEINPYNNENIVEN
ncbi:MAG: MFS transporter [Proteiniphilum sp.]|nr:MFS transporter [Proteiniphilum sp.]MDD3969561.1 MFS transporter [Proteiniphilum sp.]